MILNLIYCLTNINNPAIVIATIVILIMMSSSLNRSILIAGVSILLVTMLLTSNNNSSSLPTVHGFSPSTRSSTAQVTQLVEERQRFYPIVTGEEFVVHHDVVENHPNNNNNRYESVTTSEERPTTSSSSSSKSTITNTVEYQVTALTERIAFLTQHLQHQPTDFSTRRGLVALVNKRRRILTVLDRNDAARYQSVIKSLGIRHHRPASSQ